MPEQTPDSSLADGPCAELHALPFLSAEFFLHLACVLQDWAVLFTLMKTKLNAADAIFETLGSTFSCVELLHEAVERFLLTDLIPSATDFDAGFRTSEYLAEELTEQFFLQHFPGNDLTDVGKNYLALRLSNR